MTKLNLITLLITIATLQLSASAKEEKVKSVSIALGNFRPYFDENKKSGIFTDLIKEVFSEIPNYSPTFVFDVPNYRLWELFKSGQITGAANVFSHVEVDGCKTVPMFLFSDVAVSLKKNNLTIHNIEDLKNKSIVTFQGAKGFFGKKYESIVTKNKLYDEVARPSLQAQILISNRAQVSIGDKYIFLYEAKRLKGNTKFKFHNIFPGIKSHMAFKDQKLCPLVNAAYEKVISSGRFDKILKSYLDKLK